MPDFRARREELRAARVAADDARADLLAAQNDARRARADALRLARVAADDDELAQAAGRARSAEVRVAEAREHVSEAVSAAGRAVEGFAPLADPRTRAEEMDDRDPVLLLPVRIETRWVGGELLVRVFPDDCMVDTFEPELSENEYAVVERYWVDVWRAGGVEAGQRAAWRGLVASVGSGRASFVVGRHAPLNPPAERPVKAVPDDVVLVIATRPPPPPEVAALGAYWAAVWRAGDDAQAAQQAHAALVTAVGSARADALVEGYAPANLTEAPTPPLTRADVDVQVSFLVLDAPPESAGGSWTLPPTAELLPERFVLLGYVDGALVIDQLGEPLPERVVVGPDPTQPDALATVDGQLDAARRAALAVRLRPRRARRSRVPGRARRDDGERARPVAGRGAPHELGRRARQGRARGAHRAPPLQPCRLRRDRAGNADQQHRGGRSGRAARRRS